MATKEKKHRIAPAVIVALLMNIGTASFAQQCFTPANLSSKYDAVFLNAMIENYKTGGWKDFFICAPAFDTIYSLTIEDKLLICKKLVDAQWDSLREMPEYKTARWELPIEWSDWKVLSDLLDAATITANYYSFKIGTDGVTYYLGSWGRLVSTWWPEQGSLPCRTVKSLDTVCHAVTSGDTALLHWQLAVCRKLTGEFHLLYPLSYFYPDIRYYRHSQNIISVRLSCNHARLLVKFLVDTNASLKTFHYDVDPLGDSMAVWRRELFMNDHNNGIQIFLSDTSGIRCEIRKDGIILMALPQKNLNRQILFDATRLQQGFYELSPDGQWIAIPQKRYKWWLEYSFF